MPSGRWRTSTPPGRRCATRTAAPRGTAQTSGSSARAGDRRPSTHARSRVLAAAATAHRAAGPRKGELTPGHAHLAPWPERRGFAGPPPGRHAGAACSRSGGTSGGRWAGSPARIRATSCGSRTAARGHRTARRSSGCWRAGRHGRRARARPRPQAPPVPLTALSRLELGEERGDAVERLLAAPVAGRGRDSGRSRAAPSGGWASPPRGARSGERVRGPRQEQRRHLDAGQWAVRGSAVSAARRVQRVGQAHEPGVRGALAAPRPGRARPRPTGTRPDRRRSGPRRPRRAHRAPAPRTPRPCPRPCAWGV